MARARFNIKAVGNQFVLEDDGLSVCACDTREEAEAYLTKIKNEDAISEVIEDAILDLKAELVRRFGITLEQAHNSIREAL